MPRAEKFGEGLLTVLLWACFAGAVLLLGVSWVDSSVGIVVVLQSAVPVSAVLCAGLLVIAAVSRRWRVTVAAGAVLALCATIAVPTVLSHTVAPGRDDFVVMSANLEYGGADAQSLVTQPRVSIGWTCWS